MSRRLHRELDDELYGLIVQARKGGHRIYRVSHRQVKVKLWGKPEASLLSVDQLRLLVPRIIRKHPTRGMDMTPIAKRPKPLPIARPGEPLIPGIIASELTPLASVHTR